MQYKYVFILISILCTYTYSAEEKEEEESSGAESFYTAEEQSSEEELSSEESSSKKELYPQKNQPHDLDFYIEDAKKEIPIEKKPVVKSRKEYDLAGTAIGIGGPAMAYMLGQASPAGVINYTLATGATVGIPLALHDAYQKHQYNKWKEAETWYKDLLTLKSLVSSYPFIIATKDYFASNKYNMPDYLDYSNTYDFYIMPTDEALISTFGYLATQLQEYKKDIKYIAIRPTQGITEDKALFGTIFPRIIIATTITDKTEAEKLLAYLIAITYNDIIKIPHIGKQPSFSQKIPNNDLIFWSKGSFEYNKKQYDKSSWWERLKGLTINPEDVLTPKSISSE